LFAQAARASRAFGPVTLPHFVAKITEYQFVSPWTAQVLSANIRVMDKQEISGIFSDYTHRIKRTAAFVAVSRRKVNQLNYK